MQKLTALYTGSSSLNSEINSVLDTTSTSKPTATVSTTTSITSSASSSAEAKDTTSGSTTEPSPAMTSSMLSMSDVPYFTPSPTTSSATASPTYAWLAPTDGGNSSHHTDIAELGWTVSNRTVLKISSAFWFASNAYILYSNCKLSCLLFLHRLTLCRRPLTRNLDMETGWRPHASRWVQYIIWAVANFLVFTGIFIHTDGPELEHLVPHPRPTGRLARIMYGEEPTEPIALRPRHPFCRGPRAHRVLYNEGNVACLLAHGIAVSTIVAAPRHALRIGVDLLKENENFTIDDEIEYYNTLARHLDERNNEGKKTNKREKRKAKKRSKRKSAASSSTYDAETTSLSTIESSTIDDSGEGPGSANPTPTPTPAPENNDRSNDTATPATDNDACDPGWPLPPSFTKLRITVQPNGRLDLSILEGPLPDWLEWYYKMRPSTEMPERLKQRSRLRADGGIDFWEKPETGNGKGKGRADRPLTEKA